MSFITETEKSALSINRMIFHVVGKSLKEPILLDEIDPPQHVDFFLERVKSALRGNLFEFQKESSAEKAIRKMRAQGSDFVKQTQSLAIDFQSRHSGSTSMGVFFVFELSAGDQDVVYALVKYDNEDVVRYVLDEDGSSHVPKLERFQESFVRKAEAMQKIALVKLDSEEGGQVVVRDRSNRAHISEYFEGFLQVRRVNSPEELSEKLVEALKATFKQHRELLPDDVKRSGVNRIYEVLRQGGHTFDPEDCEGLISSVFGKVEEDGKLRETLNAKLKEKGVVDEAFDVKSECVSKPKRRRIETAEGVQVIYDESQRPDMKELEDGRTRIIIHTAQVTRDDVDTESNT